MIVIAACGVVSRNDFQMLLLWELTGLFWLLTTPTKPKLLFYFHSHLSEHSICPMFPYYCLWTVHSHFSKSLPNGEHGQLHYRARHPPPPHSRVSGAKRALTVSHSETPSCAVRCGLVQTTISFLQVKFQTCLFCFPWHSATDAVLVSFCVLTTTTTKLQSAPMLISFS